MGAIPTTGSKNMKKKIKKTKFKTLGENSKHANFYTGLNLFIDINDFNSCYRGQICYLPDGTMYRKKGLRPEE